MLRLRETLIASARIAWVATHPPSNFRFRVSKYDAGWSTFLTFGMGLVPLSDLRANHYQRGEMGVREIPHYNYFRELVMHGSRFAENSEAGRRYRKYIIDQHNYSPSQMSHRFLINERLVVAYLAGHQFTALVRPKRTAVWTILDGLHRTAPGFGLCAAHDDACENCYSKGVYR